MGVEGIEPSASSLSVKCSATELHTPTQPCHYPPWRARSTTELHAQQKSGISLGVFIVITRSSERALPTGSSTTRPTRPNGFIRAD